MARLRVLFVDDDEPSVRPAIIALRELGYICKCIAFPHFDAEIEEFQPHIAIVDRIEGTPPWGEEQGSRVFDMIWDRRFCPVVIYSAYPEDDEDARKDHPFVRRVTKGHDLAEFQTAIQLFAPQAEALEKAEQHILQQFAIALRHVAPYAAEVFTDATDRSNAVLRHGRRRLAALMDEMTIGKLASWEQYIFPPVSANLALGDVIRRREGRSEDADSFRVNLTPSCDLVCGKGRRPKVEHILAAACCHPKKGLEKTSLCKLDLQKISETLNPTVLSQGHYQRIVPFPALKGRLPTMMADMKRLELIAIADIAVNGEDANKPYVRVASVDSPFRELISWAYMQTACRPGLPDRDLDSWNKEIIDSCGA